MIGSQELIANYGSLQHYLHALRRRPHFGIILAGLLDDCVNAGVGMIRIVVEENKFLRAAFHDHVDSFTPVAMSPALFAGGIFFRKILRVVNEQVSAVSQFADALIKHGIAGLVVRGVNNDFTLRFHAEAQTALRMVKPHGLNGAAFKLGAAFVDSAKLAVRGHITHVHGEIRVGHLFFKSLLQTAGAAG